MYTLNISIWEMHKLIRLKNARIQTTIMEVGLNQIHMSLLGSYSTRVDHTSSGKNVSWTPKSDQKINKSEFSGIMGKLPYSPTRFPLERTNLSL